jgi:hypothetical protein
MYNFAILTFLAMFFVFVPSAGAQTLSFAVTDNSNIGGYEVGSKRAPVAYRKIMNPNPEAVELMELTFATSVPLDPSTVGATVTDFTSSTGYAGKIISSGSYVDGDGLHVSFRRAFGFYARGVTVPSNFYQLHIVVYADIPANASGNLRLSLTGYKAKYLRRHVTPASFSTSETGYAYTMAPVGTVGFQNIDPVNVLVLHGGLPTALYAECDHCYVVSALWISHLVRCGDKPQCQFGRRITGRRHLGRAGICERPRGHISRVAIGQRRQ